MCEVDFTRYNKSGYMPGAGIFIRSLWFIINILFFLNPLFPFSAPKCLLLRIFGAEIGRKVVIKPSVNIKYPWRLVVGDNCWIGEKVWIDNLDVIRIGKNCCISQGAMLLCGNHDYKKSGFDLIVQKIILDDGVWIGAQGIVCPGVNCKSHSVLTVGSVAVSDLEAYSIYQGNPAKIIRKRKIGLS